MTCSCTPFTSMHAWTCDTDARCRRLSPPLSAYFSLYFHVCAKTPSIKHDDVIQTNQSKISPPTHKRGVVAGVRPQQVRQQSPVLRLHASFQLSNVGHGSEARGDPSVNAEQASRQTRQTPDPRLHEKFMCKYICKYI